MPRRDQMPPDVEERMRMLVLTLLILLGLIVLRWLYWTPSPFP
jgi:hypothetical protein